MPSHSTRFCVLLGTFGLGLAACTADPVYIEPEMALTDGNNNDPDVVPMVAAFELPFRLEESDEADERAALATQLGIDVPYVRRNDLHLSLEWSLENLEDADAQTRIFLNGANEYFSYVPQNFVVDEDEPSPPPLLGDIPLLVPAGETITGVFREDQLREAAIDLELITRGGLNPFAAMLEFHEDLESIEVEGAAPIPARAMAHLVRIDLSLVSNRRVRLRYAARVRSERRPNYIHDEGLAAPADELTVFAPVEFVPPPPAEEDGV